MGMRKRGHFIVKLKFPVCDALHQSMCLALSPPEYKVGVRVYTACHNVPRPLQVQTIDAWHQYGEDSLRVFFILKLYDI